MPMFSLRSKTFEEAAKETQLNLGHAEVEELSIDGNLLEDVIIDFGQEEEDPVFDKSLLHYLDQHPIASPPCEAKYSLSFMETVLKDVNIIKEETMSLEDKELSTEFLLHADKTVSDFSSAVEQPRHYQKREQVSYRDEVPIRLVEKKADKLGAAYNGVSSSSKDSIRCRSNPPTEFFDNQYKEKQQEQEELEELFWAEDDDSKDFSSWICFDFDSESESVRFKENTDESYLGNKEKLIEKDGKDHQEYSFSTEYPIEPPNSKWKNSINPLNLHNTREHDLFYGEFQADEDKESERAINQMEAAVSQMLKNDRSTFDQGSNSELLSSSMHKKSHCHYHYPAKSRSGKSNVQKPTINIAEVDFMHARQIAKEQERRPVPVSAENAQSDFSFTDVIVRTSTPKESSRHYPIFGDGSMLRGLGITQRLGKPPNLLASHSHKGPNTISKREATSKKRVFNLRKKS